VVGRRVEEIEWPRGVALGALVRGSGSGAQVVMAHHDTVIQAEDHLLLFVANKRTIPRIEKLFAVGAGFF
jgi:trk system potassium uptake protein TrkA